jgi:nicotinate dehydrogenase subunit B
MVLGDTKLCPWDPGTNGSRSIKNFGPVLRAAGAEAREVLIQMAAEHLQLPADRLTAKEGVVYDRSDPQKRVSYGSLSKGKTIEKHLQKKPALKHPSTFRICGQSLPRADFLDKVTGKAKYAGDITLPNMLYGRVLRPPAHGAKLKAVDFSAAKEIKDARILRDEDFVGVVHPLPDMADKALSLIKAEYELPEAEADDETIFDRLANTEARDGVVEQNGDLEQGRTQAVLKFEETYFTPYVAHAATETHSAVVHVEEDSATAWVGTQRPFGADSQIANAIGMDSDKVRVITPYVGGGYGGKSQIGQAVQAARLSK